MAYRDRPITCPRCKVDLRRHEVTALIGLSAATLQRLCARGEFPAPRKLSERSVAWDRAAESRAAYDARLLDAMRALQPDLVLLLGWMHLLDGAFVEAFSGKTINLHPAYLPLDQRRDRVRFSDGEESAAFRGAHAIRDAIAARASWFGATAHEVDGEADRGRILVRKPVQLPADADIETATTRLRPVEQKVVAGAIMRWIYER